MGRLTGLAATPRGSFAFGWWAIGVAAGGLLSVVAVSALTEMPGRDVVVLSAIAAGSSLFGLALCLLGLRLLRGAPLGAHIALVAVTPVASAALGVWLGARAMFLSSHDLSALLVLLLAAGAVACVAALLVGARVARSGEELVSATRALGAEGSPSPAVGVTEASQELARVAHELEATSRRLEEARSRERALEASRRELVAWISHDLRTPLAGIRAIAEALEDKLVDDPETLDRYFATLRIEADRLGGLVDDLFELSRAQSGVIRLEWERVSLHDLVSDAIAGVGPIAEAKGVRITGRVADPPSDLHASTPELLRALRNILENAVRHTPSDGSIVVEAGVEGDAAYVSVLDEGGGILAEHLPRIFEVGFRGDAARTPGGGAGLGLAIARELVEAHRGDISVRNGSSGAHFVVRIPREPPPSSAGAVTATGP